MKPYEITLDLRRNIHQVLVMKEGDANSRVIHAKITDNGKPYSVPSAYLTIQWTKPDGNVVQNIIHTMVDDSTVEIVCTDQMLAVSGIARADITIATENEILSPMKFNISIDESAVSKNIIESSHEFGALNDLLAKNNSLGDDLRELESQLEEAESERVIAENERKANEEIRKTNEDNREDAENLRETNTSTAIQNTNNATNLANTATQNAEDATDAAIDATTKTNEATQKANTVIAKMESLMKDDNVVHTGDLGVAGGVATLDENGNIPASQLPSFVDEYKEGVATNVQTNEETGIKSALGFILSGETEECVPSSDKIYVDINENISYRWSGSMFVCIGGSLTLGINAHTAFSGDRGVALEERMNAVEEYHNNIPASDIKFDNTNTNILSAEVQGAIVELSQPATRTKDGLLSASDKVLIDNYANIQEIEAVLSASKWIGDSAPYTQTITITDLTAYNNCSVELNPIATTEQEIAIIEADVDNNILYDESTGLTFTANGTKPTIDIPILLCVGTSMNVVGVPYYLGDLDKAENISYDNSSSRLSGTNVKNAIDELDTELESHSHSWDKITDKPTTFTPSSHKHDDIYYTESEIDTKFNKVNSDLTNSTFRNRGDYPNGTSIGNLSPGIYKTYPGHLPAETILSSFSTYGFVDVAGIGQYPNITYGDVFGNRASWSAKENKWVGQALKDDLDKKQDLITGGISNVVNDNFYPNIILRTNGNGKMMSSSVPASKLDYLANVTSDLGDIGKYHSNSGVNVGLANGSWGKIATLTLEAGVWVIDVHAAFSANTEGQRIVAVLAGGAQRSQNAATNPPSGNFNLATTTVYNATAAGEVACYAYQSSGSTLTCNGEIRAVRIK